MAGHIRHVPIISHRHWVIVGCGLVDHASILGVGATHGHNYSEAPEEEDTTSTGSFAQAFLRKVEVLAAILVFITSF